MKYLITVLAAAALVGTFSLGSNALAQETPATPEMTQPAGDAAAAEAPTEEGASCMGKHDGGKSCNHGKSASCDKCEKKMGDCGCKKGKGHKGHKHKKS